MRPLKRSNRPHKRVIRQGTEWFDADGVKLDPSEAVDRLNRDAEDDQRILSQLPPHFAVFDEERK
ncbi:BAG family molecular chaperone regulator 5 [Alloscardovia venturai]|uniref:BAG family molecular chaperone regulator 5 n=1 Tax=Alloscardovia venturai TaxID=1769421 RepID=A0ABW2Y2Q2_9BIFI